MGAYLQYGRNKAYCSHLIVEMAFSFVHKEYRETLYLQFIDVLVHGEQTEPNPIFVAFFKL